MTVPYVDGFDVGDFDLRWLVIPHGGNNPVIDTLVPYPTTTHPGRSLKIPTDTEAVFGPKYTYLKRGFATQTSVTVGFHLQWTGTLSDVDPALLSLFGDAISTPRLYLRLRTDGTLYLADASDTVIATGIPAVIHSGEWYFIELSATTAGAVDVSLNEVAHVSGSWTSGVSLWNALALNYTVASPSGSQQPNLYYD